MLAGGRFRCLNEAPDEGDVLLAEFQLDAGGNIDQRGRVSRIASATVAGVRPPDRANGAFTLSSAVQSKATPLPPGSVAPAGALASNKT